MICPSCQGNFWALFHTEADGVYRCRKDRDAQDSARVADDAAKRVQAKLADENYGRGRPYITRVKK
jgi:hypothetical protein